MRSEFKDYYRGRLAHTGPRQHRRHPHTVAHAEPFRGGNRHPRTLTKDEQLLQRQLRAQQAAQGGAAYLPVVK